MASLVVTDEHLRIRFTTFEKIAGFVRDQSIPLAAIDDVSVHEIGLDATIGMRSLGTAIPGRMKIGHWRRSGKRYLVRVRHDQPAVRIDARGQKYDAYIIGDHYAATTAGVIDTAITVA